MQYLRVVWVGVALAVTGSNYVTRASDSPRPAAAKPVDLKSVRNSNLQDFVREFWADWNSVASFYDLPWSEARFDRMEAMFKGWNDRLVAVDFGALNQQGRIDYLLVRNKLEHELASLALARKRLGEMEQLLSFRAPIQKLEKARWRMESVDAQAAAAEISALPEKIKKLRERLEKGKKQKDEAKKDEKAKADSEKPKTEETADKPKKEEVVPLKLSPSLARRSAAAVNE